MSLTPQARDALPEIREGLECVARGFERLRGTGVDRIVTLTVPPSFAAKWLLPRIERFRAAHPALDIRLDTTDRLADFASDGVDIGVRYGLGGYPGVACERLLGEDVFPVCSPRLLAAGAGATLDDLGRLTLIHDTTVAFDPTFPDWSTWLRARGRGDIDATRGLRINSSLLAIQAAIDGQGVALGRSVVVAHDIAAGRLVRPFEGSATTACAYHVVYAPNALDVPKIKAVRDWLFAEVHTDARADA